MFGLERLYNISRVVPLWLHDKVMSWVAAGQEGCRGTHASVSGKMVKFSVRLGGKPNLKVINQDD